MASINLSQGITEEPKGKSYFDSGFTVIAVLLALVLVVFGGLRWYLSTLEKKGADLDQQIVEKSSLLRGERVDRLADVDKRITYVAREESLAVPAEVFSTIEMVIIPQVALSKLDYSLESKEVTLSAATDSFRSLAQQLQTLKSKSEFTGAEVSEISRNEAGRILFTLKTSYTKSQ